MNDLKIKNDILLYDNTNDTEFRKGDRVGCSVDGEVFIGEIYAVVNAPDDNKMLMLALDEMKWIGRSILTPLVSVLINRIQRIEHLES